MIGYVDASVVLRIVLGQRNRLAEWEDLEAGVTSVLTQVECLRTLDRARLRSELSLEQVADRRQAVFKLLERLEVVDLDGTILNRAASSFPEPLGTLDALHLATALRWKEEREQNVVMATHDVVLGDASRACNLDVIGL